MATSEHAPRSPIGVFEDRHGLFHVASRSDFYVVEALAQEETKRDCAYVIGSQFAHVGDLLSQQCFGLLGVGVGALAVAFVVDITRPCWVRLYNVLRPAPRLTGVPVAACSQARVFPAEWATRLADYLCRHTDVPKDIATHRLAREDGLGVHLVQQLLFQHVGTYSVILHHEKNPANVVSAGFSVE